MAGSLRAEDPCRPSGLCASVLSLQHTQDHGPHVLGTDGEREEAETLHLAPVLEQSGGLDQWSR